MFFQLPTGVLYSMCKRLDSAAGLP